MELEDILEEEKLKDPDDIDAVNHDFTDEDETPKEDDEVSGDGADDDNTDPILDDDNGGTDNTDLVDETKPEVKPEPISTKTNNSQGVRECKGLFMRLPIECFTQNEKYSDDYLKSKGLFKED